MELRQIIALFRRRAWLLFLGLFLGAAAGYIASLYQVPIYQATTKVMVIQSPQLRSTGVSNVSESELFATYMDLLTSRPVLRTTSERLGFNVGGGQIKARQVQGTRMFQVTVQDESADRSALIANAVIDVLIEQNEVLQSSRYVASEESLQAQIRQVEQQIVAIQDEMSALAGNSLETRQEDVTMRRLEAEERIFTLRRQIIVLSLEVEDLKPKAAQGEPAPPLTAEQRALLVDKQVELARLEFALALEQQAYSNLSAESDGTGVSQEYQVRSSRLETTRALYQQIYATLINNYETARLARLQNAVMVVQVEPATAAASPVAQTPLAPLAGAIGLVLAATFIFVWEYLDTTIKTPQDVDQLLGLPVIGTVAEVRGKEERAYVVEEPRSPIAEAFRTLRTNLEFTGVDKPLKTILVTSAGPNEGKTTVAVNLALVMAQAGKRVVLLDADLRRPRVHRFLNLSNRAGLSDIFLDHGSLEEISQTGQHNALTIITSGSLPPNPTELLGSQKMKDLLAHLETVADVIIIDTPPSLVADAFVLAPTVEAVLMVIRPGHTHADAAVATLEQLNRVGAMVVGVALNRIPRNRADYYGGYRYYNTYGYNGYYGDTHERPRGVAGILRKIWPREANRKIPSHR
jgi:polysaccharide biosynthesis transport protein